MLMVVALVATNSFVGKPTAVRLDTQRHWADRRMLQWGSPSPPPAPPRPPPAAVGGGAFCAAASQACGQGSQLGQICRQRWGGAVVAHYMPGAPGATEGPSLECLRSYIAVASRNSPSEAIAICDAAWGTHCRRSDAASKFCEQPSQSTAPSLKRTCCGGGGVMTQSAVWPTHFDQLLATGPGKGKDCTSFFDSLPAVGSMGLTQQCLTTHLKLAGSNVAGGSNATHCPHATGAAGPCSPPPGWAVREFTWTDAESPPPSQNACPPDRMGNVYSLHGFWMSTSWSTVTLAGIYVARYMRHYPWWIDWHVRLQTLGAMGTMGFICVAVAMASKQLGGVHHIVGALLGVATCIQVSTGEWIHEFDAQERNARHMFSKAMHTVGGKCLGAVAMANVWLGFELLGVDSIYRLMWGAWLGGVAIAFVVAEVQLWQRQQQQKQGEEGEEKEEGEAATAQEGGKAPAEEGGEDAGIDNPMHRDD